MANSNRGNAYSWLGQYLRAIQDFDEAIRLDPQLVLAYYNRGDTYLNLREPQGAVQDLDEAIRLVLGLPRPMLTER